MREILFRGKQKYTGEWIEGYYVMTDPADAPARIRKPKAVIFSVNAKCNWFNKYFYNATEVVPETIGQFTGVLDKNGKKIFEGDIVYNGVFKSCVEFYDGRFTPFNGEHRTFFADECVIIGNIHDNPELLEVV